MLSRCGLAGRTSMFSWKTVEVMPSCGVIARRSTSKIVRLDGAPSILPSSAEDRHPWGSMSMVSTELVMSL